MEVEQLDLLAGSVLKSLPSSMAERPFGQLTRPNPAATFAHCSRLAPTM
jgi:hypothetical protein